jgi:hypothetical protein
MRPISPPTRSDDDPDRHLSCQEAIQFAFEDFITTITKAGWREPEAVAAIIDMADNHLLGLCEAEETSSIIALIKRMTN